MKVVIKAIIEDKYSEDTYVGARSNYYYFFDYSVWSEEETFPKVGDKVEIDEWFFSCPKKQLKKVASELTKGKR